MLHLLVHEKWDLLSGWKSSQEQRRHPIPKAALLTALFTFYRVTPIVTICLTATLRNSNCIKGSGGIHVSQSFSIVQCSEKTVSVLWVLLHGWLFFSPSLWCYFCRWALPAHGSIYKTAVKQSYYPKKKRKETCRSETVNVVHTPSHFDVWVEARQRTLNTEKIHA